MPYHSKDYCKDHCENHHRIHKRRIAKTVILVVDWNVDCEVEVFVEELDQRTSRAGYFSHVTGRSQNTLLKRRSRKGTRLGLITWINWMILLRLIKARNHLQITVHNTNITPTLLQSCIKLTVRAHQACKRTRWTRHRHELSHRYMISPFQVQCIDIFFIVPLLFKSKRFTPNHGNCSFLASAPWNNCIWISGCSFN